MIIGLGGAGSNVALSSIVLEAVRTSLGELKGSHSSLDAAVEGVAALEDAPQLNAGMGSSIRFDGSTIQMDAGLMDSEGRMGIVASIAQVRNPIRVARAVADASHPIMVGGGAVGFARTKGFQPFEQATARARAQRELALLRLGSVLDAGVDVDPPDATSTKPEESAAPRVDAPRNAFASDPEPPRAVSIVVRTPEGVFAVAASDGGRPASLPGQVGAVSVPGAALFAGPKGAVAATGPDVLLIREMLARGIYERMAETDSPQRAVEWGLEQLPETTNVGLCAVNAQAFHVQARGPMAWASWTPAGETVGGAGDVEGNP